MLTETTRRQLQRLRFLLEEATSRSQDATEVGRHSTLVLLDGACEYAMALALGQSGQQIPRTFPAKYERLVSLLAWQPNTWSSILSLHEARNQAQHHGTVADGSNIPDWVAQAERFISSLIEAAFGVELGSVLLAESVMREDVRLQLVEAEKSIDQGDAAGAFVATVGAFDLAREWWRGQRVEGLDVLRLHYSGRHPPGVETDPVNLSLLRFEDLVEAQAFASDIGEYHWLLARRREIEQGVELTLETARRAYLFVIAWVLRWEAFASRYEARRYPAPTPEYQPPLTGSDRPVIFETRAELEHHLGDWLDPPTLESARYLVRVILADIPMERRDIWAQEVGDVLQEAVAGRLFEDLGAAHVGADGIIRFHGVRATVAGEEIRDWVETAINKGAQHYSEKLAELRAREALLPQLVAGFAAAVNAGDLDDLVLGVTSTEREDGSAWIGIQLRRDEDAMLGHLLDKVVQAVRSGVQAVDYRETTLWFPPSHDVAEATRMVASVAESYREEAALRQQGIIDVETRRQALESELRGGPNRRP
jgi:hypothetical protein